MNDRTGLFDVELLGESSPLAGMRVPVSPESREVEQMGSEGIQMSDTWDGLALFGLEEPEGELAWQARALCAQTDPESFFPEKGGSTREAKRVCQTCEVKTECLEYALMHDERFGIWGGLSERERRRVRRAAG